VETGSVAAALLIVVGFFFWTVRANGGFEDWGDQDYYRLLVRGWRQGQLSIAKEPAPELKALADPYDPAQNAAHRLGDVSYYRGRYYLYFGAAPALTLMLPFGIITGREMTTGAAVLCFTTIAFLAAAGLWLGIRRRFFPESAVIMAPLGVLALGFGTHLLALAQRPMFWELPIAAGLAFSMLAIVSASRAIHGAHPCRAMVMAGLFLGLAVASRPTCLFGAPLLLAPLWLAWRRRDPGRSWLRLALAAALPLGMCGLAMMVHNYARFGSIVEFGQHYQLSGAYEGKLVHFSARFIPHNLAVYFFQPLAWSWTFPFGEARGVLTDLRGYFGTEEVCGLAVTFVFVWFLIGVPLLWRGRAPEESTEFTANLGIIAGYFGPVAALLLSYFSTTARYQADFALGVGLVAACGMLALERAARGVRGGARAFRAMATVAVVVTLALGVIVSLDYHGRQLGRTNRPTWARWENATRAALGELGRVCGQFQGPRVLKVRFKSRPVGTVETFWRASDPRAEERILVEHIGDQLLRFGYLRGADRTNLAWGRPLRWESDHTHTVEVQLPSLYRPSRGRLSGLRRAEEFRERSGVAVWFSGGRALATVTQPWPEDVAAGGAIGTDFSGEVRSQRERLFRDDEVFDPVALSPEPPRGGVLRLRVFLPTSLLPEGEPLFALGEHYASDILFLRPAEGGFRVAFEHFGMPPVESPVLPLIGGEHLLEVVLPSCRRGEAEFGAQSTGEVAVRFGGATVLRAPQQMCYGFSPGSEVVGRNPFGTTCGTAFRGWLLEARWLP
jgi:hypothetical protein